MKRIILGTLALLCLVLTGNAQALNQTIRGQVRDAESQQALPGATIILRDGETVLKGAIADENGRFRLEDVPIGRHTVQVQFSGYEVATLPEIMITSGKEKVLEISLTEAISETELEDVVITDEDSKEKPLNEMATLSARSFSVEETKRYASAIFDPARMAQNFAGVMSSGFDMENEIVIRGNSPRYMSWRLEGIEIPNPNHFGSMGSSGGPISMLSSSTLANSDFYTGAFPAEFGNALSGIFDLRFRRGNSEKRESSIMVGVMGVEASTEGYFSKKSRASYLFNYRYSTLALMRNLVPSLDGVLPAYQDASFMIHVPTRIGDFSVFGLGGANIATQDADPDSTKWTTDWDGASYVSRQQVGIVGIKHRLLLGDKSYVKTTIAASADNYMDESYILRKHENYRNDLFDVTDFDNYALRIHTFFNHKLNAKHTVRYGLMASNMDFNYRYDNRNPLDDNIWTTYLDNSGSTGFLEAYGQWKYRFDEKWTLNSGVHGAFLTLNNTWGIDPRMALSWQANRRHRLSLAAGMHSKPEHVSTLFVERTNLEGNRSTPNKNLGFSKAAHLVMGHDFQLAKNLRLKTELYYQHLYALPVSTDSGSVESIVNMADIWQVLNVERFENKGKGQNIGLDLTLEKFFANDYYFMLTGSVFQSRYEDQFGEWRPTRYDNRYTLNLLGGKEFKVGKKKKNVLGLNGKVLLSGGNRYTPIDFEASQLEGHSVHVWDRAYEEQVADYFRVDIGISYAINAKKATHTIMIDIQNVSNRANVHSQYYDSESNSLAYRNQNGIFPLFNYRVEF